MIKDLRPSIEKNLNQLKEAWAHLTKQQKITLGVLTFVVIVLPLSLLVLKTQTNLFPKATYPTTPPVSPTPTSTPITSPVSPTPWPSSTPTPTYTPSPTPWPTWSPTPSPTASPSATPYPSPTLDNAVLLISSDNHREVIVGETAYYDVVLNTLGNEVREVDVQLLIRGPFDRYAVTAKLATFNTQFGNFSSMKLIDSNIYFENDDGIRIQAKLESNGPQLFNEGSGAIPIFRIELLTNDVGTIRAYIDSSHSYVRYQDTSRNDYDNYTPESQARIINVAQPVFAKLGDINGDGSVDISDYSILVSQFMQTGAFSADLNNDGIVDISDYSLLIQNISL